jgi:hypothetical protein
MNLDIKKSDIEKLIEVKKKDKFLNHFFTVIKHDRRPSGEIEKTEIKVWKFNLWVAIFYPIFIFHLDSSNELITISSKLNSFGKLIYGIFFMFLTFLFRDIDFVKITLSGFLILALLYLVLISFFILISFKIYRFEKKEQLKVIFETLKVIKEKSAGSHQNNNQ